MEQSRRDVECEEVAVDPLPTHGRLQQSLVLVHGHPEQGKALLVLGPRGSRRSREDRTRAYLGDLDYAGPHANFQDAYKAGVSTLLYREEVGSERGSDLCRVTQPWIMARAWLEDL